MPRPHLSSPRDPPPPLLLPGLPRLAVLSFFPKRSGPPVVTEGKAVRLSSPPPCDLTPRGPGFDGCRTGSISFRPHHLPVLRPPLQLVGKLRPGGPAPLPRPPASRGQGHRPRGPSAPGARCSTWTWGQRLILVFQAGIRAGLREDSVSPRALTHAKGGFRQNGKKSPEPTRWGWGCCAIQMTLSGSVWS